MKLLAFLFLTVASALQPGVAGAMTQNFLNYVLTQALPVGLQWLRTYPLPDPLASGDKDTIKWKIDNAKIVSANTLAKVAMQAPSTIALTIYNLELDVKAKVHAKEDIWPHPSVSADIEGTTKSASATVGLAMSLVSGKPQVSMAQCSMSIDLKVKVTGLGPLDKIADLVIKAFKGKIEDLIKKEVCTTLIQGQLVNSVINPMLKSFTYEYKLPIAAPFDKAILDYHLTAAPSVVSGVFIEGLATGEVFSADGTHDPEKQPALPPLPASVLGSHMVSAQLGMTPFNTPLWTFYSQRLLHHTVNKKDLPSDIQSLLTTNFYKSIIPKLYAAYPNDDMQVVLNATSLPHFTLTNGYLKASTNLSLVFNVVPAKGEASTVFAYSMWCPFNVVMHVSCKGNRLVGGLDSVNVTLYVGQSPYGMLGPDLIAAASVPVNKMINTVLIPILDDFVAKGIELPSYSGKVGPVYIQANLTNPQLSIMADYLLLATNVSLVIKPTAAFEYPLELEAASAEGVEGA